MNIKKRKLSEDRLPFGYYTLGDGQMNKIPTTGYSRWYHRDDYNFRYNNATKELECYYYDDENEKLDSMSLDFNNWAENPDYWVDRYLDELQSEFDYSTEESNESKLNEGDQSFVIAYREGGKDKYSSVQASSSSEALRIFNSLVDKSGRNVSNAHIAIEDVELTEDQGGSPPVQEWGIIRNFEDEDIKLATVKARTEEEARANMLIALLDAGYYEDEVTPEIIDGTIRLVKECDMIKEDTTLGKIFKVEFRYNYEEEIDGYPYTRSATFLKTVLVRAESSEEAITKVRNASTYIIDNTLNMVGDPWDIQVVGTVDNIPSTGSYELLESVEDSYMISATNDYKRTSDPEEAILTWFKYESGRENYMDTAIIAPSREYAESLIDWAYNNKGKIKKWHEQYNNPYVLDYLLNSIDKSYVNGVTGSYKYGDAVDPFSVG